MRAAVVGIGSNSVRLLVADCRDGSYETVLRDRCGTRLFAGLEGGALSEESMELTCSAVCRMSEKARALGAEAVYAYATSAARDALNRDALCSLLRERADVELVVCTGEEEAVLSYSGVARPGFCGLIDIGGGSTEWTIGRDGAPLAAISLQIGAVRLARALPIAAPADVGAVVARARDELAQGLGALDAFPKPPVWVGVGGTFTTLAAMDRRLETFDRSLVEGYVLTEQCADRWAHTLAGMPLDARCALPGLQPQRADIVVHGITILLACFQLLNLRSITVSDLGNLDGYLRSRVMARVTK